MEGPVILGPAVEDCGSLAEKSAGYEGSQDSVKARTPSRFSYPAAGCHGDL